MESSRNQEFISFKLIAILSPPSASAEFGETTNPGRRLKKYLEIMCCPALSYRDITYPFVQCIHPVDASHPLSHFGYQMNCHSITVLVFKLPLIYLIMTPKCKSSDASDLNMPKRTHKVLLLSEKLRVQYYPGFRAFTGLLKVFPVDKRGLLYSQSTGAAEVALAII